MTKKQPKKSQAAKLKQEAGPKYALLQDMFNDFYKDRRKVYQFNFLRGIFFGLGSVLGATVVLALIISILNIFTDIPGGIGDFVQRIVDAMNRSRSV